jgi:hypothetical protein
MAYKIIDKDLYLTEMILAIHHEVQSAVDYISEVATQQSTELGQSTALMGIQNIRLKLPFSMELEQKQKAIKVFDALNIDQINKNLALRKGFMIDNGKTGKMGIYTKIKVFPNPAIGAAISPENPDQPVNIQTGEIEIVFAPLNRG